MFTSEPLSDGEHVVTVTCINGVAANPLSLDLILFLSSADVPPEGILIIDDTDRRISYSEGWTTGGSRAEYNVTTHTIPFANNNASHTAVFNFSGQCVNIILHSDRTGSLLLGTFVQVFASINANNPAIDEGYSFTIDGGNASPLEISASPDSIRYGYMLFERHGLENTNHTLTIKTSIRNGTSQLWLDYFLLGTNPPATMPALTSMPSSASSTHFPSTTESSYLSQSTMSSVPSNTPVLNNHNPDSKIQPAIIAGIFIVSMLILASCAWILSRYRKAFRGGLYWVKLHLSCKIKCHRRHMRFTDIKRTFSQTLMILWHAHTLFRLALNQRNLVKRILISLPWLFR